MYRSAQNIYVWQPHPNGVEGTGGSSSHKFFARNEVQCAVILPTSTVMREGFGMGSNSRKFFLLGIHEMCISAQTSHGYQPMQAG